MNQIKGAIVAMTYNNVIGIDSRVPWHYSIDLKHFKNRTVGHPIIMGRKTWDTIKHKPLIDRRNIVISRNKVPNVECYTDIESAINACNGNNFWVIGGGQIYSLSMKYLNLLDITYVPDKIIHQDTVKFPNIDLSVWKKQKEKILSKKDNLINIIYTKDR